ncbi:MAG: L,D-transpeptidase [Propionibacterium sp.]|nr:L,D-transpeptidase [Propionibacterium sp.]
MTLPPFQLTRRSALLGAAGLALVGCSKSGAADETSGASTSPDQKTNADGPSAASITISSPHGLEAMWPNEPIDVTVANGTVSTVRVTDETGTEIPGNVTDGRWMPERGALHVRSHYTVEVTASDAKKRTASETASIATVDPALVVEVDFRYADGVAVGNGMPIWVRFDMPVNDDQRAAIEKTASVQTNPQQEGSWGWADSTTLFWRPREYWQPGSTAHVEVQAAGLPAGDTWILNDAAADYAYGDLRVLVTDIDGHQLTCYQNGEVVNTIPVSCGKPGMETMTGTKLIMDKQNPVVMDSETFGVPNTSADGYRTTVNWAQRITWSGEYFHAAPWADYAHGYQNVSHGCTGMTDANALWLYNFTQIGDPAEFTGSSFDVQPYQTIGCWTYSWEDWQAQSALSQT